MKQPELIIEDVAPQGRSVNADTKELRALADDIHTNGLKHPVLVMDGIIVDGLKRIAAYKLLGRARIPVVETTNFGEAVLFLAKVRGRGTLTTWRQVELVEDLEDFRQRFHKRRYNVDSDKEAKEPWGITPTRQLLARAIGRSESSTEALLFLVKNSKAIPEIGRRLALVKKGEDTVHGIRKWVTESHPLQDRADATATEVIAATERGFQDIGTTLTAMRKYGAMMALTRAQRADLLGEVEKIRRQLYQLAKEIKGGLQIEAKEGKRDE